jgi:hypothetical protein
MAKKEEKKEEVKEEELEIRRTEIPVYVEPNVVRNQYAISFWSATIPPQTIFIWKDEWSKEKEREEIAKKIKEYFSTTTEKVKIRITK